MINMQSYKQKKQHVLKEGNGSREIGKHLKIKINARNQKHIIRNEEQF